jgi:hypothetical protein
MDAIWGGPWPAKRLFVTGRDNFAHNLPPIPTKDQVSDVQANHRHPPTRKPASENGEL